MKFSPWCNDFGIDFQEQVTTINKMTSTMENLRVIGKTNILPFQNAVIISNKSLLALYQYLHNAYKINYILTRRLDQDILENFFSYIRGMGGANDNPNPIDFKHRLK